MSVIRNLRCVAPLLLLSACTGADGSDEKVDTLVQVIEGVEAAECPDGARRVITGVDVNGDGYLSDGEIQTDTVVCKDVLVRQDEEPVGDNCDQGGTAVHFGTDANEDGLLSDDEIEATDYVCDFIPENLTRRDDIEPGETCELGGTAVHFGPDLNQDGDLADEEIDATENVCREFVPTLSRVDEEPAGDACAYGGARIVAGRDKDLSGVLEADEVETTDFVCDEVVVGDVLVETTAQAAALANIRVVTGSIEVRTRALASLSLPALEWVGGDFILRQPVSMTAVSAPKLKQVVGALMLGTDAEPAVELASLEFASLETVGRLGVHGTALESLELASLSGVNGEVRVANNARLVSVNLPTVGVVQGGLVVGDNASLMTLQLVALTDVMGDVQVSGGNLQSVGLSLLAKTGAFSLAVPASTGALSFPELVEVQGDLELTVDSTAESTPGDLALSLPALRNVGGDLRLPFAALASIELAGLRSVEGDFAIAGARMTDLSLRGLKQVAGAFTLADSALVTVNLFNFEQAEKLVFRDNPNLAELSWRRFKLATEIEVRNNAALTTVVWSSLTSPTYGSKVKNVTFSSNPALTTLTLSSLRLIEGTFELSGNNALERTSGLTLGTAMSVVVRGNASLTDAGNLQNLIRVAHFALQGTSLSSFEFKRLSSAFSGPALEVANNAALLRLGGVGERYESMSVEANAALSELAFPAVTAVPGSVNFRQNAELAACEVDAFVAQLSIKGRVINLNNNEVAVCE